MSSSLNQQANKLLYQAELRRAACAKQDRQNRTAELTANSMQRPAGVDSAVFETFRGKFRELIRVIFESGIMDQQGWLTLPQVKTLREEDFAGTDLSPNTPALVFAFHGYGPGLEKGIFSRVGFLGNEDGKKARLALNDVGGSKHFSGWKMPGFTDMVLRPVLTAIAHGEVGHGGDDDTFVHFEDPNFSDFDGGCIRSGRSDWLASDKLVRMTTLEALGHPHPEELQTFFSTLRFKPDDSQSVVTVENPRLF